MNDDLKSISRKIVNDAVDKAREEKSNDATVLNYKEKDVRTLTKDGERWTVLNDVCDVIGIGNPSDVAAGLNDDEKDNIDATDSIGRRHKMVIVNEKGVNAVITRSRKPEAKEFGRWWGEWVPPNLGGTHFQDDKGLKIFVNSEFGEVRTAVINGKPHVAGVDIARTLEYAKPEKAVTDHCKNIVKLKVSHPQTNQYGFVGEAVKETNMIPESDIYRLIFNAADQSQNPEIRARAEGLQDWIFEDVLPEIRKHGYYMTKSKSAEVISNPDAFIKELEDKNAKLVADLEAERAEKERAIEEKKKLQIEAKKNEPRVNFANAMSVSLDLILLREFCKLLMSNGIDIGQNRLFQWLREHGYLIKKIGSDYNTPTQRAMDMGLFQIKESYVYRGGETKLVRTTYLTVKGQIYFLDKLLKEQQQLEEDFDLI
jgi:anti-repressor protein